MAISKTRVCRISKEIDYGIDTSVCHRRVVLSGCIKILFKRNKFHFKVNESGSGMM